MPAASSAQHRAALVIVEIGAFFDPPVFVRLSGGPHPSGCGSVFWLAAWLLF
jgi:hypothetical protein